jgi:hypothetical protein
MCGNGRLTLMEVVDMIGGGLLLLLYRRRRTAPYEFMASWIEMRQRYSISEMPCWGKPAVREGAFWSTYLVYDRELHPHRGQV